MNPIILNDKNLCLEMFRKFRCIGAILSGCHHGVPTFLDKTMAEVASLSQPLSLYTLLSLKQLYLLFPLSSPPSISSWIISIRFTPISHDCVYENTVASEEFSFLVACVLDYTLAVGVQNGQGQWRRQKVGMKGAAVPIIYFVLCQWKSHFSRQHRFCFQITS